MSYQDIINETVINEHIVKDKKGNTIANINHDYISSLMVKINKLSNKGNILYVLTMDNRRIKIGYTKSINHFIKTNGRFYQHTKNFKYQKIILYNVYKIHNKQVETLIHQRLAKYRKKTSYYKCNNKCYSYETYKCYKHLLDKIKYLVDKYNTDYHEKENNVLEPSDYFRINNQIDEGIIEPVKKILF
jgi:hypothetical protein